MLLQVGNDETRLNTVLDLFSQIVREPCFDTLRTKEQVRNFHGIFEVEKEMDFESNVISNKYFSLSLIAWLHCLE